jgi:hypothetical protein
LPLNIDKRRKREDIGLDIFEVKKELGLRSIHHQSILEKPHTERNKSRLGGH